MTGSPEVWLVGGTLGVLLIYLECNRPGRVVPGCVGLFLVSSSVYRLRTLPHVSWAVVAGCLVVLVASTAWLGGLALRARRNKFVVGMAGMAGLVGKQARARTALAPRGTVEIAGEVWAAVAAAGTPVAAGTMLLVTAVEDQCLRVRPAGGRAR